MEKVLRDEIYSHAKEWILEAGEWIRERINDKQIINIKSNPNDLVTEMDKQTESFLATKIKTSYPNHHMIGEEGFGENLESLDGIVWIVDPIDGTMNFVHQKRNFAISIGVYQDGVGEIGLIYDVMADELFHAKRTEGAYRNEQRLPALNENVSLQKSILGFNQYFLCENSKIDEKIMQELVKTVRGTRSYGSAALEFAYVAEGSLNGYLSLRLSPWDIAAGIVITNEVGAKTTTLDGSEVKMLEVNTIACCNKHIQDKLLNHLKKGKK